jgi:hypothetical protein
VGTRTPDLRIMRPPSDKNNSSPVNELCKSPEAAAHYLPTDTRRSETDADLADLVDAWPRLPNAVRLGILAMVRACKL